MSTDTTDHTAWCLSLFDSIVEGGVWGVPRNGLIFTKRNGEFVLTDAMPWTDGMPLTADELAEYQASEFEETREQFAKAGITVRKEIA